MKTVKINGLDFLLMAKTGALDVDMDDKGNIRGLDLDDGTISKFDGLLVALHEFGQMLANAEYTVVMKDIPQVNQNQEIIENIEE